MSSSSAPTMDLDAAEAPLAAAMSSSSVPTSHLDAAEPPLETEAVDWLAAAERKLLAKGVRVKHRFVHYRLAAAWLSHPLQIDVNEFLQVSVDGGDWHGSADFLKDGWGMEYWKLTFHYAADASLMKTTVYKRIPNTGTYLNIQSESTNQWNSMLIAKDE